MQIEIRIDESCKEPKVIVVTGKMTDDINRIIKKLSDEQPLMIAGFKNDMVEILEQTNIYRIFSANGKVYTLSIVKHLSVSVYNYNELMSRFQSEGYNTSQKVPIAEALCAFANCPKSIF